MGKAGRVTGVLVTLGVGYGVWKRSQGTGNAGEKGDKPTTTNVLTESSTQTTKSRCNNGSRARRVTRKRLKVTIRKLKRRNGSGDALSNRSALTTGTHEKLSDEQLAWLTEDAPDESDQLLMERLVSLVETKHGALLEFDRNARELKERLSIATVRANVAERLLVEKEAAFQARLGDIQSRLDVAAGRVLQFEGIQATLDIAEEEKIEVQACFDDVQVLLATTEREKEHFRERSESAERRLVDEMNVRQWLVVENAGLQERLADAERENHAVSEELYDFRTRLIGTEHERDSLQRSLNAAETRAIETQAIIEQLEEEKGVAEEVVKWEDTVYQEAMNEAQAELYSMVRERNAVQERLNVAEARLIETEGAVERLELEKADMQGLLEAANAAKIMALEMDLSVLTNEESQLINDLSTAKDEKATLSMQVEEGDETEKQLLTSVGAVAKKSGSELGTLLGVHVDMDSNIFTEIASLTDCETSREETDNETDDSTVGDSGLSTRTSSGASSDGSV